MDMQKKIDLFSTVYVKTGDKVAAYRAMKPDSKAAPKSIGEAANKFSKKPSVLTRIRELQKIAKGVAEQDLEITVEGKLAWLKEITERCLQKKQVLDKNGEATGEYKFNASDAIRAISEMNKMVGDHAPTKSVVDIEVNPIEELMKSIEGNVLRPKSET